jgi:hypothetical protein
MLDVRGKTGGQIVLELIDRILLHPEMEGLMDNPVQTKSLRDLGAFLLADGDQETQHARWAAIGSFVMSVMVADRTFREMLVKGVNASLLQQALIQEVMDTADVTMGAQPKH